MRHLRLMFLLALLTILAISSVGGGAEKEQAKKAEAIEYDPDVQILKQAGIGTDGPSLLRFLKKLTGNDDDLLNLDALIKQLGDEKYRVRQSAQKKLIALRHSAIPSLIAASRDPSIEVKARVKYCIHRINERYDWALTLPAVRLLARVNPPSAVETLVRFLPFVVDDMTEEEVWYSVDELGLAKGKPKPALVAALSDKIPARRALAACILGHRHSPDQRGEVRKLLKDQNSVVRLRAAQGLLAGRDKTGIPHLIALLDNPSIEIAWQAEELLHFLAGNKAPDSRMYEQAARARRRDDWIAWNNKYGLGIDLEKILKGPRRPKLLLICENGFAHDEPKGSVWLCGCDGKPRWKVASPRHTTHALLISPDKILIASRSLSSWNLGRKPEWTNVVKKVRSPVRCFALANGRIMLINKYLIGFSIGVEVDWEGKENKKPVYPEWMRFAFPKHVLMETGEVLFYPIGEKQPVRLEAPFKQGPTLPPDPDLDKRFYFAARSDGMSGDRFLVCVCPPVSKDIKEGLSRWTLRPAAKLLEVNGRGRILWQYGPRATQWETPAGPLEEGHRLRNGHTLLRCEHRVVEVDNKGKAVWDVFTSNRIRAIQPCLRLVRFGFDHPTSDNYNLDSFNYQARALRTHSDQGRAYAAAALAEITPSAKTASALVEALGDRNSSVRNQAWESLAKLDAGALPALIAALKHSSPVVRAGALDAMGQLRKAANDAIGPVFTALKDKDANVRFHAAISVRLLGPRGSKGVPAFIAMIKDLREDIEVRCACIDALSWVRPRVTEAIPVLIEVLKTPDSLNRSSLRTEAAFALGQIAQNNKAAVVALTSAAKGKDPELRTAAAKALRTIKEQRP